MGFRVFRVTSSEPVSSAPIHLWRLGLFSVSTLMTAGWASSAGQRHRSGGLHRCEAQVRSLCASHSRPLPEAPLPQGPVPHCGEVGIAIISNMQREMILSDRGLLQTAA